MTSVSLRSSATVESSKVRPASYTVSSYYEQKPFFHRECLTAADLVEDDDREVTVENKTLSGTLQQHKWTMVAI
jgi:hypothetical protein